jgi:hypothetical protein
VTDLKKQAEDAARKAMAEAGKDAAKRAALGLFSSDDNAAAEPSDEEPGSNKTRNKLILLGVLGLFVVIGVLGMLMSYWHWFLALGVAGIGGLYLRRRIASRLAARREDEKARVEVSRVEDQEHAKKQARQGEAKTRTQNARAVIEAEADEAQAIEDEFQELKARLDK